MNKVFAVVIWIVGLAMMITLPVFCDTGFAIRLGIAFAFSAYCVNVGNGLWNKDKKDLLNTLKTIAHLNNAIKHDSIEEDEE